MPIFALSEEIQFPPPHLANPEGILAIGGDLSVPRLLLAYKMGVFPWYSPGEPIIWWSPDPRFVLYPKELKISKSLKQVMRKNLFQITFDQAFDRVIEKCQRIYRKGQRGTWITEEMKEAYNSLHKLGYAHSVDVWQNDQLVGGLYGVSLGRCFFGNLCLRKYQMLPK